VRGRDCFERALDGHHFGLDGPRERPVRGGSAAFGASYLAGTLVPVLPVAFGARTVLPTVVAAGATISVVSALLAFLSGMDLKRRLAMNLVIIAAAVGVTYVIGVATKAAFGIAVK